MKKSMKNRVAGAAAVLLAGSMAFSMTLLLILLQRGWLL